MFRFHSLLDSGRWEAASWWLLRGGERSEPKRSNHQDVVDVLCSPFFPSLRLRPAVSGTTCILGGTHPTRIAIPKFSDQHTRKSYRPSALASLSQPHWISNKSLSHKPLLSLPTDLAIAPYPAHLPVVGISQGCTRRSRSRPTINFSRRSLLQSFVRSYLVVSVSPPIYPPLLGAQIPRSGFRRLGFEHPVHLFVCSILFGVPRSNELDLDAQSSPPGTQPRKPSRPVGTERSAIVHTNDFRHPVPRKQTQEHSTHRSPTLIAEQTNNQYITTEQIAHRQRFDPPAILSPEPAFEVHGPHLIVLRRNRQGIARQCGTPPRTAAAAATEFHSLEPIANGPGSRSPLSPIGLAQPNRQFSAPPTSMPASHLPDPAYPNRGGLFRRAVRTRASISQTRTPFALEAVLPLVAGLATDSEGSAQLRHALLGLQSQLHKPQPSHHTGDLFPRHDRRKRRK